MELLKDGERSAWLNHSGFGDVQSYSVNGDILTIKIKIKDQGKDSLQNFSYDKGDRFGDMNIETFNIHPEKWTLDKIFTLLITHPLAQWATGKQGYKLYMSGLDAKKLYPHELQRDLSPQEYKIAAQLINFSLKESAIIFKKTYDLMHELGHMKHPDHKALVEEQTDDTQNNNSDLK